MGRARRLLLLASLYLAQGMPYGFQANALPAYLRESGLSRTSIGLLGALALPWMLKPLWAPIVDRWLDRRTWIASMLLLLAVTALGAAFVDPEHTLALGVVVLVMNFFAATQDIAVDGLAVDLLAEEELGPGNAAQVVGYKLGMLAGGGLLVYLAADLGWRGVFFGMAAVFAVVLGLALSIPPDRHLRGGAIPSLPEVLRRLGRALFVPGGAWLVVFVGTYKLGETFVDAMFKPFLVDAGYTPADIGAIVGTYGMIASVLGSLAGGLAARGHAGAALVRVVGLAAALRIVPLAAEWLLTIVAPTYGRVVAATCAESFFGGALTTTVFALMMSRVDKRIGATHFTLLAAVEVWGKAPAGWVSGVLADRIGYGSLFLLGTALSVLFLLLVVPLARTARAPPAAFRDITHPTTSRGPRSVE